MNIVKRFDQYNEDHVYFSDPIKNNIMNNGNFIRIMYSTPYFVLNGIYLLVSIVYISTDKYYNKFRCSFDIHRYKDIIDKIYNIEDGILKKCNIHGKLPQYKISEQLKNGTIKIFSNNLEQINSSFLLKIAGIWETDNEYGLTYKFINI
jgi:hypothetical protein